MFDGARDPESRSRKSNIKIHEDASGSIYTTGVTSRLVHSEEEVGACVCTSSAVIIFPFGLFQYIVFLHTIYSKVVTLLLIIFALNALKVY